MISMHTSHLNRKLLCRGLVAATAILFAKAGITPAVAESPSPWRSAVFAKQWYQGKAEITRYDLQQARYGEIHPGDAVLIFVTEDFLRDKQVKYEFGEPASPPVNILKLNATRQFYTGVYPYSVMTSVFTPVDVGQDRTLKLTASSQEWCGHTFMQANLREDAYQGLFHSYFQREGDQTFELPAALLEDEIWTKLRIDPSSLPVGKTEIIPAFLYSRLHHRPTAVEPATASFRDIEQTEAEGPALRAYRIEYTDIPRTLEIQFEAEFPHAILGWEETVASVKDRSNLLTTTAKRTHTIMLDYWTKNGLEDGVYREQLGLE